MLAIQCCRAFSTACIALAEQSRAEYIPITNRPPQFGVCCAPVRLGTTTLANYIAQNYLTRQRTYTTTPKHTSTPGTSSQLQRPATHGRVCAFESRCCSYVGTRCERLANLNQAHRKNRRSSCDRARLHRAPGLRRRRIWEKPIGLRLDEQFMRGAFVTCASYAQV